MTYIPDKPTPSLIGKENHIKWVLCKQKTSDIFNCELRKGMVDEYPKTVEIKGLNVMSRIILDEDREIDMPKIENINIFRDVNNILGVSIMFKDEVRCSISYDYNLYCTKEEFTEEGYIKIPDDTFEF